MADLQPKESTPKKQKPPAGKTHQRQPSVPSPPRVRMATRPTAVAAGITDRQLSSGPVESPMAELRERIMNMDSESSSLFVQHPVQFLTHSREPSDRAWSNRYRSGVDLYGPRCSTGCVHPLCRHGAAFKSDGGSHGYRDHWSIVPGARCRHGEVQALGARCRE